MASSISGKRKPWARKRSRASKILKARLGLVSSKIIYPLNDISQISTAIIKTEEDDSACHSLALFQEGMPSLEPYKTEQGFDPPVKKHKLSKAGLVHWQQEDAAVGGASEIGVTSIAHESIKNEGKGRHVAKKPLLVTNSDKEVFDLKNQLENCRQELAVKTKQLIYTEVKLKAQDDVISRLKWEINVLKKCSVVEEN